jgi:hypothetical protein
MADALGSPADLTVLPRGGAWVRTTQAGQPIRAVPITIPKATLETGRLERNVQTTRHRYARKRADVQHQLDWWSRVQWAMRKKKNEEAPEAGEPNTDSY